MRDIQGLGARRREIGIAGQARWARELVRSWLCANGHITWQWRDPLPTALLYARYFRRQVGQRMAKATAR